MDTATLHHLHELGYRHPFYPGVAVLHTLYERGLRPDSSDAHPLWKNRVDFRLAQFDETLRILYGNTSYLSLCREPELFVFLKAIAINILVQGMSLDEKNRIEWKLIHERHFVYGADEGILVNALRLDVTEIMSFVFHELWFVNFALLHLTDLEDTKQKISGLFRDLSDLFTPNTFQTSPAAAPRDPASDNLGGIQSAA